MPAIADEQSSTHPVENQSEHNTYGQILKSSAMVGGSQVLNILIGMVRTKAMAVMLGPAGFGLFGLYSSVVSLAQTFAGMGINSSGVRQIAAAASYREEQLVAQTTLVLRRVSLFLGLLGAAFMIMFSRQISSLTFASERHAGAISGLSIAVFFTLISGGQAALIQGMRRIADLAKMQVFGALFGALCSIPLVYFFREKGVVPSLICVAATAVVTSWLYSRRIAIAAISIGASAVWRESGALLKLGIAFMASNLLTLGVAYVIRITVLRKVGYEATGLYQSAWSLGGLYVGFILQAMGADFYPRLTACAGDNIACSRLVNEQSRVGLLLAGPGVIATLTFAPLVIAIFYSAKFGAAVNILRWICLGTILQVITWPMGYVIVAKAKRALFIGCEVAWSLVSLGLAWVCITHWGLTGAGISFFGSYIFHGIMLYAIVARLCDFRWSSDNKRTALISLSLVTIVFCGFYLLPLAWGVCLGIVAFLCSGGYSIRVITTLLSPEQIPRPIKKLLAICGLSMPNRAS
jgi:antigen flippase